MSQIPPIDAVVFDIGNVLITWQPERRYDAWIGESRRREMFAAVDLHAMNERFDAGENFREVVEETAAAHPGFHDEILMWHDRWCALASPVIDHSVRLLRALKSRGVPVFALSNFGVDSFALSEAEHDFLRSFDRRYISGHMKVTKPDPRIYEMVEADCGLSPERLLFTDDRAENIAAAKARGWQVHLFDGAEGLAARLVAAGLLSAGEAR